MPPMTAKRRANLKPGQYVYGKNSTVGGKGRKAYPIDTKARARNALSRAAQSHTSGTYAKVERAVNRKWPSIRTRNHNPTSSRGGRRR